MVPGDARALTLHYREVRARLWPARRPVIERPADPPPPRPPKRVLPPLPLPEQATQPLIREPIRQGPPILIGECLCYPTGEIVIRASAWCAPSRYRKICGPAALEHGVPMHVILSDSRRKHHVRARHAIIVALHLADHSLSLPMIGRLVGGRDHTTVLHALRKAGIRSAARVKQEG